MTAPEVTPEMMKRLSTTATMPGTAAVTTPQAMSRVNGTMRWPLSAATTTVTGWEDRSLVSTSGNRNCAQPSRKVMMAAAAMPGRATGMTIRVRARSQDAPSTKAASSSERGTELK